MQRREERRAMTVTDLCREYLAKAEAGLIIGRKGLLCTENSIRVALVTESPTVGEPWSPSYASC